MQFGNMAGDEYVLNFLFAILLSSSRRIKPNCSFYHHLL
jgi:hypothetical protein